MILSLEYSSNLLSISISNNTQLFYREVFGNLLSSHYILVLIKTILIKNNLKIKDIKIILIGDGNEKFTSIRIFFSIIQSFSIIYNIPVYKISSINALAFEIYQLTNKKYIFIKNIITDNFTIFFFLNNFFTVYKKNTEFIQFAIEIDSIICFQKIDHHLHNINLKKNIVLSKSIYLDRFFRQIYANTYILPNNSNIAYFSIYK